MAIKHHSNGTVRWGTLGAIAALLVVVAAGWLAAGSNEVLASSGNAARAETAAARYFRALGAPRGAGALADFRRHDRDGMQNEDASGSYRVKLPPAAILDHYRRACRRAGLSSPASAETLTYYADALCDGAAIVSVVPRCDRAGCTVFVEVIG